MRATTLIKTFIAMLCAAFFSTGVLADQHIPKLSLDLRFDIEADGAEATSDSFFETIAAHDGQIVFLDLTIRPNNAAPVPVPGYSIFVISDSLEEEVDPIFCGAQGTYGLIDNSLGMVRVETKHPTNYHAPTTLVIGDRILFPHQHIACSVEGYTDNPLTPLIVRGYFSVQTAEIPTAMQYSLTPANP